MRLIWHPLPVSVLLLRFKISLIMLRPQATMPLTADAVKLFVGSSFVLDNAQGKQSSMAATWNMQTKLAPRRRPPSFSFFIIAAQSEN